MGAGNAFLLKGDLHVDVLDDAGNQTGQRIALNTSNMKLTPPSAKDINQPSFMDHTYGQTLDSIALPGDPATLAFTTNSFPADQFDLLFSGEQATLSQASGIDVAFSATAKLGKWVKIGDHVQLSALTVAAPVSMVEGLDYEVDYAGARIRALTDGGISDGATVSGTYDHAAVTGRTLSGASKVSRKCMLYFKGRNMASGERVLIDIWEANLKFGAISPIGEDFMAVEAEGNLITPTGKSSPYRMRAWNEPAV